jgi:Holliday junction resolvase
MSFETYRLLTELHGKYGAQEFGKLCQKLLAIAFRMAGYGHVVERGVQGVDVDAVRENGERYAIEVKTGREAFIVLDQNDFRALDARRIDGYRPVLAVLRLALFSEWYFVEATTVRPGRKLIELLRPYRLKDLENRIKPYFDQAVPQHFKEAMDRGQAYLDEVLRTRGVAVGD